MTDKPINGQAERVAFDIYSGDASDLSRQVVRLELVMGHDRSRAVDAFAALLRNKLLVEGYLVISDIDNAAEDWHEEDVLNS